MHCVFASLFSSFWTAITFLSLTPFFSLSQFPQFQPGKKTTSLQPSVLLKMATPPWFAPWSKSLTCRVWSCTEIRWNWPQQKYHHPSRYSVYVFFWWNKKMPVLQQKTTLTESNIYIYICCCLAAWWWSTQLLRIEVWTRHFHTTAP